MQHFPGLFERNGRRSCCPGVLGNTFWEVYTLQVIKVIVRTYSNRVMTLKEQLKMDSGATQAVLKQLHLVQLHWIPFTHMSVLSVSLGC